ncbi:hypothetical protein C2845_PMPSC055782 [Panicum miliaceum]|uniref:Uncharacterized protein n=1 Tax=Panicum miliaceum TaxID=4540 RepID=A0A3L6PAV9_PANMI|nr:hypothetical protein C2845_PMPSC055782 [Panicum miliaceum]
MPQGGATSLAAVYERSGWDLHMFPPGFPQHLILQQKRELTTGFQEWSDGAAAEVDINAILYGDAGPNRGGCFNVDACVLDGGICSASANRVPWVTFPEEGRVSGTSREESAGKSRHDDVYSAYIPTDSNKGWHDDWFYIRNPTEAPSPKFHGERPVKDASWSWGTSTPEKALVKAMKEIIQSHVVKEGLNGVRLFHTMRERRVMPLVERMRPMWLYSGPSDPDRVYAKELPDDKVWS